MTSGDDLELRQVVHELADLAPEPYDWADVAAVPASSPGPSSSGRRRRGWLAGATIATLIVGSVAVVAAIHGRSPRPAASSPASEVDDSTTATATVPPPSDTAVPGTVTASSVATGPGGAVTTTGPLVAVPTGALDRLSGSDWFLYGLTAAPGVVGWNPGPDLDFGISATGTIGTVAVNTGCNAGSASVTLGDAHRMTISGLTLSTFECSSDGAALQNELITVLSQPLTWSIDGHRLLLTPADPSLSSLDWRDTPDGDPATPLPAAPRTGCPSDPPFAATTLPAGFSGELIAGDGGRITISDRGTAIIVPPVDPTIYHLASSPLGRYINIARGAISPDSPPTTPIDVLETVGRRWSVGERQTVAFALACGPYAITASGVSADEFTAFIGGLVDTPSDPPGTVAPAASSPPATDPNGTDPTSTAAPPASPMSAPDVVRAGETFMVSFTGALRDGRGGYALLNGPDGGAVALLRSGDNPEIPMGYDLDVANAAMLADGISGDSSTFILPPDLVNGWYTVCTANSGHDACAVIRVVDS